MNINSFGGSDLHQDLLDAHLLIMARDVLGTEQGTQSPRMAALLAAMSTIIIPYSDPRIDALAQGRDGISDGKVWFIQQDLLVEKARRALKQDDSFTWFEESLKDVIAIAQGGQGQHVQSISSEKMAEALASVMDPIRSSWRDELGYDEERLEQKPVINALGIWQSKGADGFLNDRRILGSGTYNEDAQDIIACLWKPQVPEVIANPASEEPYRAFLNAFTDLSQTPEIHSTALRSIGYMGIAERYLGTLSLPENEVFLKTATALKDIGHDAFLRTTPKERQALIDVLSSPGPRLVIHKLHTLLTFFPAQKANPSKPKGP